MDLKKKQIGDYPVLRVGGSVNLHRVRLIMDEIRALTDAGRVHIIISLRDVTSIDSSSIGTLLSVNDFLSQKEGSLRLAAISDSVRSVLDLTSVTSLFRIFDTEEDAAAEP